MRRSKSTIKSNQKNTTRFKADDLYDDCPVCILLQKSDREAKTPTMKETKHAFTAAKKKGARVGTILSV